MCFRKPTGRTNISTWTRWTKVHEKNGKRSDVQCTSHSVASLSDWVSKYLWCSQVSTFTCMMSSRRRMQSCSTASHFPPTLCPELSEPSRLPSMLIARSVPVLLSSVYWHARFYISSIFFIVLIINVCHI